MKTAIRKTIAGPSARHSVLANDQPVILMMHRFRDDENGVAGHDPSDLRKLLERVHKERRSVVTVQHMFERFHVGDSIEKTIAFTMDDGYKEQACVAAAVFAEYDCPVTIFLITGFTDGQIWPWWDKVEHALASTAKTKLEMQIGSHHLKLDLSSRRSRLRSQEKFIELCKTVADVERLAAIERLASQAEVSLPDVPPARYQPLSWDAARACESRGVSFGAHTITHPILARVRAEQSATEIRGSWQRLQQELASPVPVFCYPNGTAQDYGRREIQTLREIGMMGALSVAGKPSPAESGPDALFRVARIPAL